MNIQEETMTAQLIDGKKIAQEIREEIKEQVISLYTTCLNLLKCWTTNLLTLCYVHWHFIMLKIGR